MERVRILLAVLVVALVAPAGAADFTVTTTADGADANLIDGVCNDGTGECTLRAAIQTANAEGGADDVLLAAGVYELSLKRNTDLADGATGDLDVTSDITVTGIGNDAPCSGIGCSSIDAKAAKDRVFDVAAAGDLRLENLSVANGKAAKDDFNPVQILDEVSGGCIRVAGDFEADDFVAQRCSSPDDGGCIGFVDGATGAFEDSLLTACKAKDGGGGIESDLADVDLERVTISGSSAGDDGGGIELSGGQVTARNLTLSGNKAREGAGLELEGGATAVLNNVTLAANKASDGASLHNDGSTITISNSIVSSKKGNDCSGPVTSDDNNIDGGTSCGFGEAGDQSNVDPLLEELLDNGGEVPTHALGVGSPAIDRGDDGSCENEDARNQDRFDVNGVGTVDTECDVGAFEFIPPM